MNTFSICIAARNEGENLKRTVSACVESMGGRVPARCEIVVVDDASDVTVDDVDAIVLRNETPQGVAKSRLLAVNYACGSVIVGLDAHCRPEPGAIQRLVEMATLCQDDIVTPCVTMLEPTTWVSRENRRGYGQRSNIVTGSMKWESDPKRLRYSGLRRGRRILLASAFCSCAYAVTRKTLESISLFDEGMNGWGIDPDMSYRVWTTGHRVVVDPHAIVGHLFRKRFPYPMQRETIMRNRLRFALKCFRPKTIEAWLAWHAKYQGEKWPEWVWDATRSDELSVAREQYLRLRKHDEYWYTTHFNLGWPGKTNDEAASKRVA